MFLIERIVSLFTYAFVLFLVYELMKTVAGKQWKYVLLCYLLVLCVFAFNYKPYVTADLYRLRQYIKYWINLSPSQIVLRAIQDSTPSWILYSYVINKMGNQNWLQTVTCCWSFGNVFYIITQEIEKNDLKKKLRGLPLFYIMAVGAFFLQTISGIRSMLGISIIAFCVYRDTIEKCSITKILPLYLFAALLHEACIPLVITRFIYYFFQQKRRDKKIFALVFISVVFIFAILNLQKYINAAINLGKNYLFNNEYTYYWEIAIGVLELFQIGIVLARYRHCFLNRTNTKDYDIIYRLCLLWVIVSLAALPLSYAAFRRYTMFCSLLSIPLLVKDLCITDDTGKLKSTFIRNVWILSFAIFSLSGVRGDLCGYKFFVR